MSLRDWAARLKPDTYVVLIALMVVVASLLPAQGVAEPAVKWASKIAIGFVFFLHGARLSREAVVRGFTHWRLHLLVLGITFALFPLMGMTLAALPAWIAPPALGPGIVLLACLPSTVQSSIGFTSIARGNVAAAVAAATASNLLGIVVTPILVAVTLHAQGGGLTFASAEAIVLQLLAPFIAGQLLRPLIGGWIEKQKKVLSMADRGSILLVVYSAFSDAVTSGLWDKIGAYDIARLIGLCIVLLAAALLATRALSRLCGFATDDEIVVVFCGSKKSLASGVPMASVLVAPALVGPMILPLMIFHQIQLMACAVIAQNYAKREDDAAGMG